MNGIDEANKITQLRIYYNWAKQRGQLEPLRFISCPDFRKAEIELEIEAEMKDKYEFVEYSKICRFIDDVNKKNYFKGFPFEEGTFKTLLMHLTSLVIKINQNCLNNSFWNQYKKLSLKLS